MPKKPTKRIASRPRSYNTQHLKTEVIFKEFDPLKARVVELEASVSQLQEQMALVLAKG